MQTPAPLPRSLGASADAASHPTGSGLGTKILGRALRELVFVALAAGAVIMIWPFLWMVLGAFKTPYELIQMPPSVFPARPVLDNFKRVLDIIPFGRYYLNSILVSVTVTVTCLLTSSLAGFVFAKYDFPGKKWLFYFIIATIMVPFQVVMVSTYLVVYRLGFTNSLLALIIPGSISSFGIFLMRQFMHSVPDELLNAARLDGCSEFAIYWRIVLPEVGPALAAFGIFQFLWSWNDFLWPLVVIDSMVRRTLPLGIALFASARSPHYGMTMAAATMAVVPTLIVYLVFQRQFIQGIALTGMKG